jgi:hypothetical protein
VLAPIAAHAVALAVQALTMGPISQLMLTPNGVGRDEVIDAFEALARGAQWDDRAILVIGAHFAAPTAVRDAAASRFAV